MIDASSSHFAAGPHAELRSDIVKRYDPEHAPDPDEWLALDEQIHFDLAEKHHRRARIQMPSLKTHRGSSGSRCHESQQRTVAHL